MFGISELAITLIVAIVIFGAKKLPERALSMGKSARILKSEAKAMKSDQTPPTAADAPSPEATPPRIIQATSGDVTSPSPTTQPGNDTSRP
ncbi:twin-arginine translocase TatA/TatE family subunit [Streptomyces decoyicus]|uniref:Sec-independent protein translocase protein TatA n=1 Tax=Streptomyces decoyicus TaxID=249567 RepID=A0ABZ1FF28_9ACTN|nr:twin-arginine translocase TatA/TatE family subunit [Streptomyces decoyicus]WSB68378.1 twin-arginine translocase TatA/TatE family subunit [Streptomyces decoyicus]